MTADLSWALGEDLPLWAVLTSYALGIASLVVLLVESYRRRPARVGVLVSGVAALLLCLMSVLRPAQVTTRGSLVGPRVVVLLDESRRLELPGDTGSRRQAALNVLARLASRSGSARMDWLGFGQGELTRLATPPAERGRHTTSDLGQALDHLARAAGERPQAVIVVSDGRLGQPPADLDDAAFRRVVGALGVPVHTIAVAERAPRDASVRGVRTAGAAVAHQPFTMRVEVGCEGLDGGQLPVHVRELRAGVPPAELGRGMVELRDGEGAVELEITLDRAGNRVVEVAIDAPSGDSIPDNDHRILTFRVTRERVRLLHIAGRPTYDVRALRRWLKSDESVDLVAFFILREEGEDPLAEDDELALIRFPVEELFTQHLSSFDAVILQDIDAVTYQIAAHLPQLGQYVTAGGGLIMVGGASSFGGGGYAGSDLVRVLPVELPARGRAFDVTEFVPRQTGVGRMAPVLRALGQLLGDQLPGQPGSNLLGPARPNAMVLWEHPRLVTPAGPMPVLAMTEAGDGRSIALGVDGTHLLAFSELAAKVGGRAYGALWDGLLGWLMRDPRLEAVGVELIGDCEAELPVRLRVIGDSLLDGDVAVDLARLGMPGSPTRRLHAGRASGNTLEVPLGALAPGGYSALVRVGAAPPTRLDFACERGGEAWSDSRPDAPRLGRIARLTGGRAIGMNQLEALDLPRATRITAERHVTPLLPSWVYTLGAATLLGLHWILRRKAGLL